MQRCIFYRCVVPSEKRCMKKEEETGMKPSYCLFDGDYDKCRFVESVMKYRDLERGGKEMVKSEEKLDEQLLTAKTDKEHVDLVYPATGSTENGIAKVRVCICGGIPRLAKTSHDGYHVFCDECGARTFTCKTPEKALSVWDKDAFIPTAGVKDSGERREFDTGAVRDMAEGKGLMVVMPASALLRLSRHYEHGAKKYGRFNWQKGIPISSFMDSALRHIMKYLDGWDDEDHLSAAAFNILGAMEMEAHKPGMQDIPAREGKQTFNYKGDEQ